MCAEPPRAVPCPVLAVAHHRPVACGQERFPRLSLLWGVLAIRDPCSLVRVDSKRVDKTPQDSWHSIRAE
eukprot:2269518-Pyramimonas_sp.AAC.1